MAGVIGVLILSVPIIAGLVIMMIWPTVESWRARRRRRKNRYWK